MCYAASVVRRRPLPALLLSAVLVAACGGDDSDRKDAEVTEEEPSSEPSAAAEDETMPSPENDETSPAPEIDLMGGFRDPGPDAEIPAPEGSSASSLDPRLVADVCARAAECDAPVEDCAGEFTSAVQQLWLLCPRELETYLECASKAPTCDPAVDCDSEWLSLEAACVLSEDDAIRRACSVQATCGGFTDSTACVQDYQELGSVLDAICPGVFGDYVECVATMSGCDEESECGPELLALGRCAS